MFEAIYFFILFSVFFYIILKSQFFQIEELNKWIFPSVFVFKTLIGFGFVYYFLNIGFKPGQPSDVERFLNEGKELNAVFYRSPKDYFLMLFNIGDQRLLAAEQMNHAFLWRSNGLKIINDTRNLVRFHSILNFISFGYNSIHILFFEFISTTGLILLFKGLKKITLLPPLSLLLILVFFPSLLFWSSGILKETFVILGISLFINALFCQINYSNKIIFSLISFIILFLFKPYILICIIISSTFYCIYILTKTKSIKYSILSFIILFSLVLSNSNFRNKITTNITIKQNHSKNIAIPGLHVRGDTCLYYFEKKDFNKLRFYNDSLIEVKTKTKALYRARKDKYPSRIIEISPSNEILKIKLNTHGANSYFHTTPINNQFSQLIKNLPEALLNSFFRPFPNENGGIMKFISILDVYILYAFLIFVLLKRPKLNSKEKILVISLIIFILILFTLIGLISCVSGEIVRYRLPGILALLIVGLISYKRIKINNNE
jgi:hypothetical protein